jgi:MATE family multidrug resistance protein
MTRSSATLRGEFGLQLRLALPIAFVQIGMVAMGVVDTFVCGRLPEGAARQLAVGAVSLGHTFTFLPLMFGMGILMVLDPLVSQAVGARDRSAVELAVHRSIPLIGLISLPSLLTVLFAAPLLRLLGQPPELIPIAVDYAWAVLPSVPFFYGFMALRLPLQAQHRLRPLVVAIVLANVLNLGLNFVLVQGLFGFPQMGAVGSGVATSLVRVAMFGLLAWFARHELGVPLWPLRPEARSWKSTWSFLLLGLPIGLQMLIEGGAFHAIAIMMGWFGKNVLSGHMVTLHYAALAFMVPMGISQAAAVRVGYEIGAGNEQRMRRAAWVATLLGTLVMCGAATIFVLLPEELAWLIAPDEEIVRVAALLLPIAGAFQIVDGLQVVATGALRGAGDFRAAMLLHLLGFWGLGIPVGVLLTFGLDIGPEGLWMGLAAGLFGTGLLLLLRMRLLLARGVGRLDASE